MFLARWLSKVFGSRNDRLIKAYQKKVAQINALEPRYQAFTEADFPLETQKFKERLAAGEHLKDLLPEAFALVREASKRTLQQRHFDVQLIGGMVLHEGKIAEMRTGEGKTLTATLPTYLNALSGEGVHIITVNDYLAKRDADWNRPIYDLLGLTVGVILHGQSIEDKQAAYQADITYGTNNEFGFDYLRDNMAFEKQSRMQRGLPYAIIDEVDSILIDEARTPLIISGADEDSSALYLQINALIPKLDKQTEKDGPGDYSVDEKNRQAFLTETGHEKVESLLLDAELLKAGESLYDPAHIMLMHHLHAGLKAHALFKRDVDYMVKDGKVMIVDEHTGRLMEGRRWSEGIHQAVEAKEGLKIQAESQTLASITFQNFFKLYQKLSGMTGTADTEAYEFQEIYGLEVVVIPTNKPSVRQDKEDIIYLTQAEKFDAIIQDIEECQARKQPVLVGTASIETSEYLSSLLKKKQIAHQVLNAKYHEQEAHIIAEAGTPGCVTIATNMAGRGTDIVLGGSRDTITDAAEDASDESDVSDAHAPTKKQSEADWHTNHNAVVEAGGLRIIGTERHESRRIDNQLRGRSGRQGDPGSTQFYLSIEDNLMRIFISDRVSGLLSKLGLEKGEAITHGWVSRAIENAQRKVEGHHFDIRKQLLEFDNVSNDQRQVIYNQRNELLEASSVSELIQTILTEVAEQLVRDYVPENALEDQWELAGLDAALEQEFMLKLNLKAAAEADNTLDEMALIRRVQDAFEQTHAKKQAVVDTQTLADLEKSILLNVLDNQWKEHLATMDYLRQSVNLRGYAQKDPKQEYKREAFELFSTLLMHIKRETALMLTRMEIRPEAASETLDPSNNRSTLDADKLEFQHAEAGFFGGGEATAQSAAVPAQNTPASRPNTAASAHGAQSPAEQRMAPTRMGPKIGRNQTCPCGSGRKYKQCHGKVSVT